MIDMSTLSLIVHNVRSAHNVGSILRTADGLGIDHVYLTGYSPYPYTDTDDRLPHEARKVHAAIHKSALGAEQTTSWSHDKEIEGLIQHLKSLGTTIVTIEQTPESIELQDFLATYRPHNTVLIVGNEVTGIDDTIVKMADMSVEIKMYGRKESFNVAIAAALALYQFKQKLLS